MKAIKNFFSEIWTLLVIALVGRPTAYDLVFKKEKETGDEKRWRDDNKSTERTMRYTVVLCATDVIVEQDLHRLVIRHVRTLEGRGFMASIENLRTGTVRSNGSVFIIERGEDNAYLNAMKEGHQLLLSVIKEYNDGFKRFLEYSNRQKALAQKRLN